MMIDRLAGNAALKDSVRLMLGSRRLTHSVLLVGETGLGAGYAARCVAADYLYPAGGAPAEALLRGECCRAVGKAGDRDSGRIETGVVELNALARECFGGRLFRPLQRRLRDELNRQPFCFFLSDAHRERWTHWKNRCYGMSERNAAALLLLTADEELWQRVLWHFDSSGFDFPAIRLSGIHPELYSIYQAAKTISVGGDNIVIEDLAFSELVSDRAFRLILGALLLCRYGEVVLNLERKTEEIT